MPSDLPLGPLPLHGLRVLDLADQSGFVCGRILADLGADVVKVEPPEGDPGRRVGPFADDRSEPDRSLTWLAGNVNKRGVTCNLELASGRALFRRLVHGADAVIESFPPARMDALGLGYASLAANNPALVWTSITPFGIDGPRADWPAGDLEINAASGCLWLAGDPDRPPVRSTLPTSPGWAGMCAAMGTLMALLAAEATGLGQRVDLSAQASMLTAISHAPIFWDLLGENPSRSGPFLSGRSVSGAAFRNIWPCRDGHVTFSLYGGPAGRQTGRALVAWMNERGGAPEGIAQVDWDRFDVATVTPLTVTAIEAAIGPFLLGLTRQEFFVGVIERNMLGYPVATVEDIAHDEQLAARGFWQQVESPWGAGPLSFPGSFALFDGQRPPIRRTAPHLGEHNQEVFADPPLPSGEEPDLSLVLRHRRKGWGEGDPPLQRPPLPRTGEGWGEGTPAPLETVHPPSPSPHPALAQGERGSRGALAGLLVLELGGFAAGPVVGKHLANHGAAVIKIESTTRLDGFRTNYPPFKDRIPGTERAGIFNYFNDGKRSLTLNLKHPRGLDLARRLALSADVLVENFTPGTLARLGLAYDDLAPENPGLVMLSTCNQGQFGPHARHAGFGTHLTSLSGFTQLLGWPDDTPSLLYGPYIDFVAVGYGTTAVLAALRRRHNTGRGCHIDLSQYESGLQLMAPALLDLFVNGRVASRAGNRDCAAAPHGVFPCRGHEDWVALSASDDEEWRRFVAALDEPAWAREPAFATIDGRKANEDRLETSIADWTRQHERDEIVNRLRLQEVKVYPVNSMADLLADPQLAHRHAWRPVEHSVLGRVHVAAPPFTLSRTPAQIERPSPTLGQHNRYVLGKLLGLDQAEIDELEREGVLE